ncbi:hypothetical protein D5018_05945 [Parashewanella curva]|uniref:Uncharacterized protein n=1 Tax=Parashewanella curva TaxID=2338552 RepID=A0A3L8PZ53_9GAMM|nr:hypothetical protein [Parashewanella curva]RLV60641.1 hypothetical protein D5018_05945 [Parashewanella curva]
MSLVVSVPLQYLPPPQALPKTQTEYLYTLKQFENQGCLIRMLCGGENEDQFSPFAKTEQELDELLTMGYMQSCCTSLIKSGANVPPYKNIGFILNIHKSEIKRFWGDWVFTCRVDSNERIVKWMTSEHNYRAYNENTECFDLETQYAGEYLRLTPVSDKNEIHNHIIKFYETYSEFLDYIEQPIDKGLKHNELTVTYNEDSILGVVVEFQSYQSKAESNKVSMQLKTFRTMVKEKLRQDFPCFCYDSESGSLTPFLS